MTKSQLTADVMMLLGCLAEG